jgi:hypothetical protein
MSKYAVFNPLTNTTNHYTTFEEAVDAYASNIYKAYVQVTQGTHFAYVTPNEEYVLSSGMTLENEYGYNYIRNLIKEEVQVRIGPYPPDMKPVSHVGIKTI